jgi:hypothetical protein
MKRDVKFKFEAGVYYFEMEFEYLIFRHIGLTAGKSRNLAIPSLPTVARLDCGRFSFWSREKKLWAEEYLFVFLLKKEMC